MSAGPPRFGSATGAGAVVPSLVFLAATSEPEVGPAELVDYWPFLVQAAWFFGGFLVVFLVGWYGLAPLVSQVVRKRNRNNPTLSEALSRYVRVLILVVAIFVGAGAAGYGLFLTNSALVLSAITLAVGVAGQQVIGSIISGLALVTDPKFSVGSYIEWEDGEGTVQSITLRVTRVLTPDGELLTIPNTTLTSQTITMPFGQGRYRVVQQVGLAYEDDIGEAMEHLVATATEHDSILAEPNPNVYVEELGDDAVVLGVYYWIKDPNRRELIKVKSEYSRAIKTRLEEAGITISPAPDLDLQGRISIDDSG